jgi:hypothetical protein
MDETGILYVVTINGVLLFGALVVCHFASLTAAADVD